MVDIQGMTPEVKTVSKLTFPTNPSMFSPCPFFPTFCVLLPLFPTLQQLIALGASDPHWLSQICSDNAEFGALIVSGDVPKLRVHLMKLYMKASHRQYEANKELDAIARDPDNPEHQRKIEAAIRQQNIEQNLEAAYENMPESFGRICMLYVNVHINGNPCKAFVDSGAQMTIMSQQMAERMGILRLMDARYAGMSLTVHFILS